MTENNNRAVITGLGMICAIGNSVDEAWNNAINSVSGIHKTTTLDTTDCYADLAAEVKCDTLGDFEGSEDADRSAQLCIKAAGEAMKDAGLDDFAGDPKASVIIGSCVGGAVSISDYYEHGKKASDVTKMPISSIAPQVAGQCHAGGVVTNIANACAAGTISIAYACELIRAGKADVVLAGGSDTFAAVPYAGFLSLHALDADGCSPFNRCTGITLGEGSGVVVVESYEHAKARNAKMYCEVLGAGVSSDAHHITAPRPDGEGQMEAINKEKLSYFTNLAHEFKTPLTLIQGPASQLVRQTTDPKEKEDLQIINRNAQYLLSLVNQLIDLRKIDTQNLTLNYSQFNFSKFLNTTITDFSNLMKERNISFEKIYRLKSDHIYSDKENLHKILFNLLSNAIKHTPDKGKITLHANQFIDKSNKLMQFISVTNSGSIIAPDEIDKIFNRFLFKQHIFNQYRLAI